MGAKMGARSLTHPCSRRLHRRCQTPQELEAQRLFLKKYRVCRLLEQQKERKKEERSSREGRSKKAHNTNRHRGTNYQRRTQCAPSGLSRASAAGRKPESRNRKQEPGRPGSLDPSQDVRLRILGQGTCKLEPHSEQPGRVGTRP